MPRPRKPRFVLSEPGVRFFKPQGIPLRELENVSLSVEELEAMRLIDCEELYQEAAAERMEISRQTFQRVLREGRKKTTDALVNGKALGIEGGNYIISGRERIFECIDCGHSWDEPFGSGVRAREASCPECGGPIMRQSGGRGFGAHRETGRHGRPGRAAGRSERHNRNRSGAENNG